MMSSGKDIAENIRVFVRQRPELNNSSESLFSTLPTVDRTASAVQSVAQDAKSCMYYSATNKMQHNFSLDQFFLPSATQEDIYDSIARPIVESALQGYAGTILAYGPTSSGKTFTMRGNSGADSTVGNRNKLRGVMPRCVEHILSESTDRQQAADSTTTIELWASYLQIYCENITDLITPTGISGSSSTPLLVENASQNPGFPTNVISQGTVVQKQQQQPQAYLQIREKAGGNEVYVDGVSRVRIAVESDLWEVLRRGDERRNTAATNMNETSSRSHAVLMLNIVIREAAPNDAISTERGSDVGTFREGSLVLVDLAGSERASASDGRDYMRLEEAKSINLSLSALGNCMSALAEASSKNNSSSYRKNGAGGGAAAATALHIPYRDSKLTRLLQNSLGGSSRTAVIVNIPPGLDHTGEILSALRFASRASKVKVLAKVSRHKDYGSLYLQARKKLDLLERGAGGANSSSSSSSSSSTSTTSQEQRQQQEQEFLKQKEAFEHELQRRAAVIEQQSQEIAVYKQQLALLQQTQQPGGIIIPASSGPDSSCSMSGGGVTDLSPAVDKGVAADICWEKRAVELNAQFSTVLQETNTKYQAQIRRLQAQLLAAQREINELTDDLKAERQRHLNTMTDYRTTHEKLRATETSGRQRVSELLAELAERRSKEDDVREELEGWSSRALAAERAMGEMVSKDQVKEMENLFLEAVTRLSDRVNALEAEKKAADQGQDHSTAACASDIVSNTYYNNNISVITGGGGGSSSSRFNHANTSSTALRRGSGSGARGGGIGMGIGGMGGIGGLTSATSGSTVRGNVRIEPGGHIRTTATTAAIPTAGSANNNNNNNTNSAAPPPNPVSRAQGNVNIGSTAAGRAGGGEKGGERGGGSMW